MPFRHLLTSLSILGNEKMEGVNKAERDLKDYSRIGLVENDTHDIM